MTGVRRWRVELDHAAARELRKLGASERQRILMLLRERLATDADHVASVPH